MQSDLLFFIGVFVFIFIVWVATGGPDRPISFAGPYLHPIETTGVTATAYGTPRDYDTTTKSGSIGSQLRDAESNLDELKKQVADLKTFGDPSPYRGLITIEHSTSGPGTTDYKREYVSISLSSNSKQDITITGWTLRSETTGISKTIPRGTDVARTGSINSEAPITLIPGDRAIISTYESPIGDSFRENMCTGYLGQYQTFTPSLYSSCPAPGDEFGRFYEGNNPKNDDACYDFVRSISRCSANPSVPRSLTNSCRDFADDYLNYNGCVRAHRGDASFSGTTWRIFLDQRRELWRSAHETIKLLDQNGKTVDVFAY